MTVLRLCGEKGEEEKDRYQFNSKTNKHDEVTRLGGKIRGDTSKDVAPKIVQAFHT